MWSAYSQSQGTRGHTLQGLALLGASALGGNSFTVPLPIHFPERTIRPPSERMPDPSDIPRWEDLEHVPGRDMIDQPIPRPVPIDRLTVTYLTQRIPGLDYDSAIALSDISHASCLWDAATFGRRFHWGAAWRSSHWRAVRQWRSGILLVNICDTAILIQGGGKTRIWRNGRPPGVGVTLKRSDKAERRP